MLNEDSIHSEIRKYVSDLVDSGVVSRVEWITDNFLNSCGTISGDGTAIYRYCTRQHVHRIVKKVVGKYAVEARAVQDENVSLPGFEYLQRAYTMQRDNHIDLVPIEKCRDEELLARAVEYDQQARGCRAHARELRSFVKSRSSTVSQIEAA